VKNLFVSCLLLLYMLAAAPSHAAGGSALEAVEALRRGFAGINDFTAEVVQEKRLALMKKALVSRGMVRFKRPDLFYMELYPPHASKLMLKDNVVTMRIMDQGSTDRMVLPPEESLKKWFDLLATPLQSLPEGLDVRGERRGKFWNLQIFPKGKGAVQQLSLSFDMDGRISRIVIEERNRDRTTLSFSNLRRNVGLQDRDFRVE
jgi:outer membrane lipoprotein carrier protein